MTPVAHFLLAIISIALLVSMMASTGLARPSSRQRVFSSEPVSDVEMDDDEFDGLFRQARMEEQLAGRISCRTCRETVRAFQKVARVEKSEPVLVKLARQICIRFNLQTEQVCQSAVGSYTPWLLQVIRSERFDPSRFCGMTGRCLTDSYMDWTPAFPKPKPDTAKGKRRNVSANGEKKYILHLSDWHFDPLYMVGYEAECADPLCCRPPHAPLGGIVKKPAGLFGEFKCDTPRILAESVLQHAKEIMNGTYDFVMFSGDLPPHDIWVVDEENVIYAENEVAKQLQTSFKNTHVFMSIGNHESVPPNSFPSHQLPDSNVTWLYESLAKQWAPWMPPSTQDTFKKFGYYSSRRKEDNLRVIVINSNFAYLLNWWIFVSESDPDNMLHWLISELQEAEDVGEDVYILGHIPPSNADVSRYWSFAFNEIVKRYSDTILGQFYGHTHTDAMQIVYDQNMSTNVTEPVNVVYVCPSITPFVDLNPGFRVYEVDAATNVITNHFTYVMDLQASNSAQLPIWNLEYDAKSAYEMKSLSPKEWHKVTVKMANQQVDRSGNDFLDKYLTYRVKSKMDEVKCGLKCRKSFICAIRTSQSFGKCFDGMDDDPSGFYDIAGVDPFVEPRVC